jgi:hypothetical protein
MNYEFLFSLDRICNGTVTLRFSALIQNLDASSKKSRRVPGCASEAFAGHPKNDSVARNRACCISLITRGARGSSDQSDLRTRTDLRISDGLQVSDTFQALIGSQPIAIWEGLFCVEISRVSIRML